MSFFFLAHPVYIGTADKELFVKRLRLISEYKMTKLSKKRERYKELLTALRVKMTE